VQELLHEGEPQVIALLISKAEHVADPRERLIIGKQLYRIDACGRVLHDWPLIEQDYRHYAKTKRVIRGMAVYELVSCSTLSLPFPARDLFKKGGAFYEENSNRV
jgi:hypothetical protein